jgi:hypothetical protein
MVFLLNGMKMETRKVKNITKMEMKMEFHLIGMKMGKKTGKTI